MNKLEKLRDEKHKLESVYYHYLEFKEKINNAYYINCEMSKIEYEKRIKSLNKAIAINKNRILENIQKQNLIINNKVAI